MLQGCTGPEVGMLGMSEGPFCHRSICLECFLMTQPIYMIALRAVTGPALIQYISARFSLLALGLSTWLGSMVVGVSIRNFIPGPQAEVSNNDKDKICNFG